MISFVIAICGLILSEILYRKNKMSIGYYIIYNGTIILCIASFILIPYARNKNKQTIETYKQIQESVSDLNYMDLSLKDKYNTINEIRNINEIIEDMKQKSHSIWYFMYYDAEELDKLEPIKLEYKAKIY